MPPPARGQCCLCRGGPGVQQGTARGAYRGGVGGEGLGTRSVLAVSRVRGAHADLFACIYGLVDGELKGRQGLSLASRPPGTAVQAKAVYPSMSSAAGRVGAVPTCCQARMRAAAGGCRQGPEDGGCRQRLWRSLGCRLGAPVRSVCAFSSLHPTYLSPNLQQTSTIPSCPVVPLPTPMAPLQPLRRGTGPVPCLRAQLSGFPCSSLPIPPTS